MATPEEVYAPKAIRSDGSIPFTEPQTGVDPTDPQHLATKQYVDSAGGGGGGAPTSAEYIVGAASAGLSAERVVTNTATITWDLATSGQAKANVDIATVFATASDATLPLSKLEELPADKVIGTLAVGSTPVAIDCTAAGRDLIAGANAAAQRGTLGLGTIATEAETNYILKNGTRAFTAAPSSDVAATTSNHLTRLGEMQAIFDIIIAGMLARALLGDVSASGLTLTGPGLVGTGATGAGQATQRVTIGSGLSLSAGHVLSATGGGGGGSLDDMLAIEAML